MSEKEKMMSGSLYDPRDEELSQNLQRAKALCHELNQIHPKEKQAKNEKLLELLPAYKVTCHIEAPFFCDYGTNIQMGDHVYLDHNVTILDAGGVTIGNHVFIGPNVCLTTAGHPEQTALRNAYLEYAYPIVIEDDVWIGANVVVNPGVTIKAGSIIGSGSVVTHDIDAHVVACGVPCKTVRSIQETENATKEKAETAILYKDI